MNQQLTKEKRNMTIKRTFIALAVAFATSLTPVSACTASDGDYDTLNSNAIAVRQAAIGYLIDDGWSVKAANDVTAGIITYIQMYGLEGPCFQYDGTRLPHCPKQDYALSVEFWLSELY
jgi:hypothetical protein